MNFRTCILAFIVGVIFTGCKSNKNNQLIPPFEDLNIPYESFLVDPAFGSHIYLRDGSQIIIPPYAFADKAGNLADQTVTVSIRRFGNAASVIASGLPVPGSGEGQRQMLAAAFEIRASMDTTRVEVAPRQEIQVLIGCECTATAYDVCHYTGPDESWEPQTSTFLKINTIKRQLQAQPLEVPPPPVKIPVASAEDSLLELDYPLYRISHLRIYPRVVWQYLEGQLPESLERGSFFLIPDTLTSKFHFSAIVEEDTFKALLAPRIAPEDSADAANRYDRAMEQWERAHEAVTSEELNLQELADYLYQVPVKKLGFYGLTGPVPGSDVENYSISFTRNGEKVKPKAVYVVNKNRQVLLRLTDRERFAFQLPMNQRALLLLIFPKDEVVIVPFEKFDSREVALDAPVRVENMAQLDSLLVGRQLSGPT